MLLRLLLLLLRVMVGVGMMVVPLRLGRRGGVAVRLPLGGLRWWWRAGTVGGRRTQHRPEARLELVQDDPRLDQLSALLHAGILPQVDKSHLQADGRQGPG